MRRTYRNTTEMLSKRAMLQLRNKVKGPTTGRIFERGSNPSNKGIKIALNAAQTGAYYSPVLTKG